VPPAEARLKVLYAKDLSDAEEVVESPNGIAYCKMAEKIALGRCHWEGD